MKRTALFFCSALALAAAVSCEKDPKVVDFPIVGDLSLSGEGNNVLGTWLPGDKIGVFVTSDGVTQENLLYTPSETAEDKSMDLGDGRIYHMYGDEVGNVALTPSGVAAGFKQGDHAIYAYAPYDENAKDVAAVPVPDLTEQDATAYEGQTANPALCFVYATAELSEYSAATVDLGTFACDNVELNTGTIAFDNEEAAGKTLDKISFTATETIAYKNCTYNFIKGEYQGEATNTVTLKTAFEVDNNPTFDFESMQMVTVTSCSEPIKALILKDVETAKSMQYTVEATLSDGSVWTATVTPAMAFGTTVSFSSNIKLSKK